MRSVLIFSGAVLLALCVACWWTAQQVTQQLLLQWQNAPPDPTYWNGFIQDHLTLWLIKFGSAALLFFGAPGILLLKFGLAAVPKVSKGQIWKRDGGWGEWRP